MYIAEDCNVHCSDSLVKFVLVLRLVSWLKTLEDQVGRDRQSLVLSQNAAPMGKTAPNEITTCIWFTPSKNVRLARKFVEKDSCLDLLWQQRGQTKRCSFSACCDDVHTRHNLPLVSRCPKDLCHHVHAKHGWVTRDHSLELLYNLLFQ